MESWQGEAKVPMVNATGLIRRDMDAPTVDLLAQYIRQSPAFIPLCLSENAFEWETKERGLIFYSSEQAFLFRSQGKGHREGVQVYVQGERHPEGQPEDEDRLRALCPVSPLSHPLLISSQRETDHQDGNARLSLESG